MERGSGCLGVLLGLIFGTWFFITCAMAPFEIVEQAKIEQTRILAEQMAEEARSKSTQVSDSNRRGEPNTEDQPNPYEHPGGETPFQTQTPPYPVRRTKLTELLYMEEPE